MITSDKNSLFPGRQLNKEDRGGGEEERGMQESEGKKEIVAKVTVEIVFIHFFLVLAIPGI